jgi:hypothetical protein
MAREGILMLMNRKGLGKESLGGKQPKLEPEESLTVDKHANY